MPQLWIKSNTQLKNDALWSSSYSYAIQKFRFGAVLGPSFMTFEEIDQDDAIMEKITTHRLEFAD